MAAKRQSVSFINSNPFKTIFYKCPDAIFIVDLDFKILMANPYAVNLLGFDRDTELIGRNITEFISENDKPRAHRDKSIVERRSTTGIIEYRFFRKDGTSIECQITDTLISDEHGNPRAIMGIVRDISEQKKMEMELYESEVRFRNLFESSLDGVAFTDLDGRFYLANDAYLRITGYSLEELLSMTYRDLTPDRWHEFEAGIVRNQILVRGYTDEYEKDYIRKDGSIIPVSVRAWLVRNTRGEPARMWGIVRDITERKRAEQKIHSLQHEKEALLNELLIAEERERRKIAMDLHDNLNQSLALVKIRLAGLKDIAGCDAFREEIDDLSRLMDQAIDFTRNLTDQISPPILYQLGPSAAIKWLAERTQEKYALRIECEIDPDVNMVTMETGILIFKIIRELVVNIIKHSQAPNAAVTIWRNDSKLSISVKDNGLGFDITELALNKSPGFGLIGIRERLNYAGGTMNIMSRPGEGTNVIITIPLENS